GRDERREDCEPENADDEVEQEVAGLEVGAGLDQWSEEAGHAANLARRHSQQQPGARRLRGVATTSYASRLTVRQAPSARAAAAHAAITTIVAASDIPT